MRKKVRKNKLEWIVFSISAVIITFVTAFLIYQAFNSREEAPPDIIIEAGAPQGQTGKYIVPVTVKNEGEQTAEDVNIVVTIEKDGQPLEEATFVVPFIPRKSERESWAVFTKDPAQGKITAKATGFNVP
jgi:uncharacterized protein (TIGR02588 family)